VNARGFKVLHVWNKVDDRTLSHSPIDIHVSFSWQLSVYKTIQHYFLFINSSQLKIGQR